MDSSVSPADGRLVISNTPAAHWDRESPQTRKNLWIKAVQDRCSSHSQTTPTAGVTPNRVVTTRYRRRVEYVPASTCHLASVFGRANRRLWSSTASSISPHSSPARGSHFIRVRDRRRASFHLIIRRTDQHAAACARPSPGGNHTAATDAGLCRCTTAPAGTTLLRKGPQLIAR